MKKTYLLILFLLASITHVCAGTAFDFSNQDTARVNQLNKEGFKARFSDHDATIAKGQQALDLAQKLNYINGMAEAYRTMGIGESYANHQAKAISDYEYALSYFKKANNTLGQAKVYNNIGTLYLTVDYDEALEYLQKGLAMAQSINNTELMAKAGLNIGSVFLRKKNLSLALEYYTKSEGLFKELNDQDNLIICMQNQGVIYMRLRELDKAEEILLNVHDQAKARDMNMSISSIDLDLSSIFIDKREYDKAQKFLDEGVNYAQIAKDDKLEGDFIYNSYQLELHRKDYEKAVGILHKIYVRDSTAQASTSALDLKLMQDQHDQQEKQKENELIIERQKNDRVKFWWAISASGLLLIVIALLVGNVKRKAKTNFRLTELNAEVSRQKDNLDRINHHLEEIIDERTRDLQIKNKKLSEYSSYLSHQIRGPIATLKGLMNLEKEGLVDQEECINMMNKCVSDIDEKIIDMTDILHDPKRTSF
ncbi:MAG: tetratricopeptide repeat protein [Bacteroidetes bacterium]|nr:tetratricopeptide repeat protein [Bacteroidota bacterium]